MFLFDVRESRLRHCFTVCCLFLDTPLCFARFVSFFACDAACRFSATSSKSTCSNRMTFGRPLLLAFGFSSPSGILLCFNLCHAFFVVCNLFPLCQQPQLQTELPSERPTDFSISTSISCFRSLASFASIDLASHSEFLRAARGWQLA